MRHLIDAFEANRRGEIEVLDVFHNPRAAGAPGRPQHIVGMRLGRPDHLAPTAPAWFHEATLGTPFEFAKLQALASAASGAPLL